jgi:hypothetical protein
MILLVAIPLVITAACRDRRLQVPLAHEVPLRPLLLGEGDGNEQDHSMKVPDITRKSLEEDAREWSTHDTDPAERFWMRQKGWKESAHVGATIIKTLATEPQAKKEQ